jgi:hypothetical protein
VKSYVAIDAVVFAGISLFLLWFASSPQPTALDEVITLILVEFDLKTQFEIRAQRGQGKASRGLELLDKAKGLAN